MGEETVLRVDQVTKQGEHVQISLKQVFGAEERGRHSRPDGSRSSRFHIDATLSSPRPSPKGTTPVVIVEK